MLSLVRARIPSITLWTTLETGLIGFVAYQWSKPSEFQTPLKSAIPAGHIGAVRFHRHHQPATGGRFYAPAL
ncbi:hypothetical protein EIP91_000422 [Steccherinum ochraceum]|uniref:Uncharacterized protein n=1 Tax=Steccherinum ochraceum TaxID=92696 RepID=A0A4R0RME8_9APHY|nr:hypothetical protein EIP91_000422 [Steccherinum ochraceum]